MTCISSSRASIVVEGLSIVQKTREIEHEVRCPLTRAAQELSGKWDLVICHLLLREGRMRFNEIKTKISEAFGKEVCPSSISSSLKRLEEEGIVNRTVNVNQRPISVHYELTEKGKDLEDLLKAMLRWGEKWA